MCFINLLDLLSLLIIHLGSHTYLRWNVQICSDSEKQIWRVAIVSGKTQNASFALRGRLRSPSTHTSFLWAVSVLNSITLVLPVSDRSYERNNTPFTLSCLTPFAQRLEIYLCWHVSWFIFSFVQYQFHPMNVSQVLILSSWCTFEFFPVWDYSFFKLLTFLYKSVCQYTVLFLHGFLCNKNLSGIAGSWEKVYIAL